jgi:hypothetical protein
MDKSCSACSACSAEHSVLVADNMELPLVTHEATAPSTSGLPDLDYSLRECKVDIFTF